MLAFSFTKGVPSEPVSVFSPERLEASQCDEKRRPVPADEVDAAELIGNSRYRSRNNGLFTTCKSNCCTPECAGPQLKGMPVSYHVQPDLDYLI